MVRPLPVAAALLFVATVGAAADEGRDAVSAPVGTVALRLHAVGAQVYRCESDTNGRLVWMFREPVATLMNGTRTVGRHYAGPTWELGDGSLVVGKLLARAAGQSAADIPWLKLSVAEEKGDGALKGVTTVQRIATEGGNREGPCFKDGALLAEPYAADYVFSRP